MKSIPTCIPAWPGKRGRKSFNDIAFVFEGIGKIEKAHKERYLKLLEEVETGRFFAEEEAVKWKCRNRGNISMKAKRH